eukprot:Gb_12075 [translate_table: standard]
MSTDEERSEISEDSQPKQIPDDEQQAKLLCVNDNSRAERMKEAPAIQSRCTETQEIAIPQPSPLAHGSSQNSVADSSTPLGRSSCLEEIKPEEEAVGKPPKIARLLFCNDLGLGASSNALFQSKTTCESKETLDVKMVNDDDKAVLNERIVNEMLHDTSGTFPDSLLARNTASGKLAEIQAQIKSTMEKAFWDGVVEALARNPPDYAQVIGLVKEVRDELDALVPQSWKQELRESIDLELFTQILESGTQDVEYLAKLLDYALGVVLKLGAPARDNDTKAAHEKLVQELSEIVAGMGGKSNLSFACALVKGLRFILEQIQVLKQDISSARIRALTPLIQGPAGVEYMQKAFTAHYGPSSRAISNLPQTVQWLVQVKQSIEEERDDFNASVEAFKSTQSSSQSSMTMGLPLVTSFRTGSHMGFGKEVSTSYANATAVTPSGETQVDIQWTSMGTLIRLGLLQIASRPVAANEENTPETLKLNIERLRNAQNDFQRIIVIATGLLLVRQTLAEKEVPPAEIDNVLHVASKQLNDILSNPMITSHHIGQLLAQLCSSSVKGDQPEVDGELMTRVLSRSLSASDAVFARVSAAAQSGVRAILLLGKGFEGLSLAEAALKRIGASSLIDLVVGLVDTLEVIASVSCQVHGPWYMCILNMTG